MSAPESSKRVEHRILFVCLGNICRSPTAEAVFRDQVARAGLAHAFEIDSCGTSNNHVGEFAHPRTRATAEAHGISIVHRARQLVPADFEAFDLLLAMDLANLSVLRRLAVGAAHASKLRLFRDFEDGARAGEREMPDPYYTGEFERVFALSRASSEGLLRALRSGTQRP